MWGCVLCWRRNGKMINQDLASPTERRQVTIKTLTTRKCHVANFNKMITSKPKYDIDEPGSSKALKSDPDDLRNNGDKMVFVKNNIYPDETSPNDFPSKMFLQNSCRKWNATLKHYVVYDETICAVCGVTDPSLAFHCGAYTCEACKKFFVRSTRNPDTKYECNADGKCTVTPGSRSKCRACRFNKCIAIGMARKRSIIIVSEKNKAATNKKLPEQCHVCGSSSSGFHFGAVTCEGCKGFFSRCIRNPPKVKCLEDGQCSISQNRRNACQYCRFQKCLAIGMSKAGSRLGRPSLVEKVHRERSIDHVEDDIAMKPVRTTTPPTLDSVIEECKPDLGSLAPTLKNSKSSVKEETDDAFVYHIDPPYPSLHLSPKTVAVVNNALEAYNELLPIRDVSPEMEAISYPDGNITIELLWERMMASFIKNVRSTLFFAKKIDGFRHLNIHDQIHLVQTSVFPIVVTMLSIDFDFSYGKLNYFMLSHDEMLKVKEWFQPFYNYPDMLHSIGETLSQLNMDDVESSLLCYLILASTECPLTHDHIAVLHLQESTLAALEEYVLCKHGWSLDKFGVMLLRLGELRRIQEEHFKNMLILKKSIPNYLKFPELFYELYFLDVNATQQTSSTSSS